MFENKLGKFIKSHRNILFGFYLDVTGACCLNVGKYLISIFQNTITDDLELRVDSISSNGIFDNEVEWLTPLSEEDMAKEICRVVKKFSREMGLENAC